MTAKCRRMTAKCRCCRFIYNRILSSIWKNALAILRVKKNFLSVPDILNYSYWVRNILLGHTFPNISKNVPFICLPRFITSFVRITADSRGSILDSFFCIRKSYIKCYKETHIYSNNFFCEIEKIKESFL